MITGFSDLSLPILLVLAILAVNILQLLLAAVLDIGKLSTTAAVTIIIVLVPFLAFVVPLADLEYSLNYTVQFNLTVNIVLLLISFWLILLLLHNFIVSSLLELGAETAVVRFRADHPLWHSITQLFMPPLTLKHLKQSEMKAAYPVIMILLVVVCVRLAVVVPPFMRIEKHIVLQDSSEVRPSIKAASDSWLIFFLDKFTPIQTKIAHRRVPSTDGVYLPIQVIIPVTGFTLLEPAFAMNGGCITVYAALVPEKNDVYEFDSQDLNWLQAQLESDLGGAVEEFELCDR